ncbi:MAG: hypothetical protein IK088_00135 [Lachnospiraceae bacterium]|nr:hypothetical protein [Lachnospiraceae bacterium]
MKEKVLKGITIAWLVIESVLFLTISIIRIIGEFPAILCQLTTFLSFLTAVAGAVILKRKELVFLSIAMCFTVAADVFLVWIDGFYEIAVTIFLFAQIMHFLRLAAAGRPWKTSLMIRIITTVLGIVLVITFRMVSYLTVAGVLYAAEILINTVDSGIIMRKQRRFSWCFAGFILFLLCDVTVGLRGIGNELRLSYQADDIIGRLTWIFYIPSQVGIVLSGVLPVFRRKK